MQPIATSSGDTLLQNNHHIVGWPKLYSLGCSTVAKISELLGSPSSWLDSNFKFSQIYEHYFFDWLCVFPTNKTFIIFDYFISAWPLLWLAPHCTILCCLAQPHCNALYCLAHHHCIEVITPISHAPPLNCTQPELFPKFKLKYLQKGSLSSRNFLVTTGHHRIYILHRKCVRSLENQRNLIPFKRMNHRQTTSLYLTLSS